MLTVLCLWAEGTYIWHEIIQILTDICLIFAACVGMFFKIANKTGEDGVSNTHHEKLASCKKECIELDGCVAFDYVRVKSNDTNCIAYFPSGTDDTKLVPSKTTDHYVYTKCVAGRAGCLNLIIFGRILYDHLHLLGHRYTVLIFLCGFIMVSYTLDTA